jgi:hypothetical protein
MNAHNPHGYRETGEEALKSPSVVFRSAGDFMKCLRHDLFWFDCTEKQTGALALVLFTVLPALFCLCLALDWEDAAYRVLAVVLGLLFILPIILLAFLFLVSAFGFVFRSGGK